MLWGLMLGGILADIAIFLAGAAVMAVIVKLWRFLKREDFGLGL